MTIWVYIVNVKKDKNRLYIHKWHKNHHIKKEMDRMAGRKSKSPTFIIQVKGTDNHTWQGIIKWVEEDKLIPFRSALELLQLMDSAIGETKDNKEAI